MLHSVLAGESGDVDRASVDDWKSKLPQICRGYEPKDIWNYDETGLIYKSTDTATLAVKGEKCQGGKLSKERVTLVVCSSMTGEKEPLMLIGKFEKLRCFKKIETRSLPVKYHYNKKAWMTSRLNNEMLIKLNKKMKLQNRNILLFLDNCPAHPKLEFSNITLQFFPPNTTSMLQPMDQGIIQTLKLKHRKKQLAHLISLMDKYPELTGSQLLKKIDLLDTIYWVAKAWDEVETKTINKCFKRCGFDDVDEEEESDDEDDIPLALLKASRDVFGCELKNCGDIDCSVQTCDDNVVDWNKSAKEILKEEVGEDGDGNEEEDEADSAEPPVTLRMAESAAEILKRFSIEQGLNEMLDIAMKQQTLLTQTRVQSNSKQQPILSYFKQT